MSASFEDWLAICETKARYCRCMDTKDWAGWADVFTPDLVLDSTAAGGFRAEGREASIKTARASIEHAKTAHQVHNPEITFTSATTASVIWAMNDRVEMAPERHRDGYTGHTGYGHYHEIYVKCDDGKWRIKESLLSYLHFDRYSLQS